VEQVYNMQNFSAQFQGIINTNFGQKILDFLALVPSLEARFGKELKAIEDNSNNPENIDFDRLKQAIGHMVRVIMEEHGYLIDQNNVKIPDTRNTLFSRATRYKKA